MLSTFAVYPTTPENYRTPMAKTRKSKRTEAVYRKVITAGNRTVRISTYPPREDQTTGVTLGIGYANPEAFAKIFFEVTPEVWREVQESVKKAFAASEQRGKREVQEILQADAEAVGVKTTPVRQTQPKPKPPPKKPQPAAPPTGTRKRKSPAERRAMQPTPEPGSTA